MSLKIYNTLSRKKETLKPIEKNLVKMYVCGPTIYNYVHIGNLRAYVFADILRRVLKLNGFGLKEVMNLTDVDDKTIRDSQKENVSLSEFTLRYEKSFLEDIKKMNIEIPEVMPKATLHIKEMVNIIETLLKKGFAYKADDGIYFDISKLKNYGELAQLKKTSLKTGASERVLKDEYDKENANDFVLWKFYDEKDGDVFWETEIGKGRPGWHIECSAMSSKYLGEQFDIHTGGVDLIFPHHTNEIAQSESAFGVHPWVKFWMHNEFVLVDGKKMSKSLKNFYTLRDLIKKEYAPLELRYFFLSKVYRQKLNFTFNNLDSAKNAFQRLRNILSELKKSKEKVNEKNVELVTKQFTDFVNDDLNTPRAVSYMWEILRDDKLNDSTKYKCILEFDNVLGLNLGKEEKIEISKEIEKLVKKREEARKKKDFTTADKYRDEISKKGFVVEDKDGKSVVRKG